MTECLLTMLGLTLMQMVAAWVIERRMARLEQRQQACEQQWFEHPHGLIPTRQAGPGG